MKINSLDVFDTIIARRCIYPNYIFFKIEEMTGIRRFCKHRIHASYLAAYKHKGNHTFEDIYNELAKTIGLTDKKRKAIMNLELRLEFENIIPVTENIEKIHKDTVLISDMYLPSSTIKSYLKKVGVIDTAKLIKTVSGKSSGKLWLSLANKGFYFDHMGDSCLADLRMAQAAGMTANLTTAARPTHIEKELLVSNLSNIAFMLREARLKTSKFSSNFESLSQVDYKFNIIDYLSTLQANSNLPILIKLALFIIEYIKTNDQKHVLLFSSRGSHLLFRLCKILTEELNLNNTECIYWLSSRDARYTSSKNYIDYCLSLAGGSSTVFIDLTGSGLSFTKLKKKILCESSTDFQVEFLLGIQNDLHERNALTILQRTGIDILKTKEFIKSCFRVSSFSLDLIKFIEFLNFSPESKMLDIVKVNGGYLPLREEYEFDQVGKMMISHSSYYCERLIDNIATLIAKDYAKIKREVNSQSFDYALSKSFVFAHSDQYLQFFNDFFKEGHLRSEAMHLKRDFDSN